MQRSSTGFLIDSSISHKQGIIGIKDTFDEQSSSEIGSTGLLSMQMSSKFGYLRNDSCL
jgi:hypothetical protein